MHTAIGLTLLFVSATSALGAHQSLLRARATRMLFDYLGAMVGAAMTVWCACAGVWQLAQL